MAAPLAELLPIRELLTGLTIGGRLFMIALGLSLIFGVLGVLNFAHGVLYMVGAYVAASVTADVVGNFWIAVVVAAVVVGLLGVVIEVGFLRRVYDRDPLDQLILTFAFVLIINDLTRIAWGTRSYTVEPPAALDFTVRIAGGPVLAYRLFVIAAAAAAMGALWFVLRRTYVGRLVRATTADRDMAALLGADVPRLYTVVFFAGSALAGIGGALAAPLQAITPGLGNQVIIDAFVIVVIGGLGSFGGAFVGAMIIGLLQSFGVQWFVGADLVLPFVAMILVLVARPQGLFGAGPGEG